MAKRAPLTRDQLLTLYGREDWALKAIELQDLTGFLSQCIIRGDYRISDDLNGSIQLSESGEKLVRELGKKQVPIKEARMMCLLQFVYIDPLIDVEQTDLNRLAAAISKSVLAQELLFPFVHGPSLYERAADLFPDERSSLGITDTLRLLEDQPVGVFQMGFWLSGPFGLLRSHQERGFGPTRRVPLQHCHDVSCVAVHPVTLDTDSTASVNEHRHKATLTLEAESEEPSQWALYFSAVARDLAKEYDDLNPATLLVLLGGAFSDHELALVTRWLLDNTRGEMRAAVESLGRRGSADEITEGMERAELLQLALLCSDLDIERGLDELIYTGQITVPEGEVRRSLLYPQIGSGAFSLRAEASAYGIRYKSPDELGPLRLRRLVDHIFFTGEPELSEELNWQLRSVIGGSVDARLEEYLRTESPEDALRRLVLARRRHVEAACNELRITRHEDADDGVLVNRMLWKLGFDVNPEAPLYIRFWELHERMTQSARSASVSTIVDHEAMRGLGANYFVALEQLLADTLGYAAWALTSDHIVQKRPFVYVGNADRLSALDVLTDFEAKREREGRDPLVFDDRLTLYGMCRGFGSLAAYLEEASQRNEDYLRPPEARPDFAGWTELQKFPFDHTLPFLDLAPQAQSALISTLKSVSRELVAGDVADVRNEQLHFRRAAADLERLLASLACVERAVRQLESAGLTRILYFPDRHERDRWGRSTYYLTDRHGREIAIGRPTDFTWLNLPGLRTPQYLMTAAIFAEPAQILRMSRSAESHFTNMWLGVPSRREPGGRAVDASRASADASAASSPVA